MSKKLLYLFIAFVVLVAFTYAKPTYAQGSKSRTIKVASFEEAKHLNTPVYPGDKLTYQLAQCPDPNEVCSVTIASGGSGGVQLRSTGTLSCMSTYNNGLGIQIADLSVQVSTTFYGTYGAAPFSWNAVPVYNYHAGGGWHWAGVYYGQNPGVGSQVSYGISNAAGQLYLLGNYTNHLVQININNGPWYCSGF